MATAETTKAAAARTAQRPHPPRRPISRTLPPPAPGGINQVLTAHGFAMITHAPRSPRGKFRRLVALRRVSAERAGAVDDSAGRLVRTVGRGAKHKTQQESGGWAEGAKLRTGTGTSTSGGGGKAICCPFRPITRVLFFKV